MTPDQWLELVRKDALEPDATSQEEYNTLRMNYVIWEQALNHLVEVLLKERRIELDEVLGFRTFPKEIWESLFTPNMDPSITPEEQKNVTAILSVYQQRTNLVRARKAKVLFYKKFDEQFTEVNGRLPAEVEDSIWRQKAMQLIEAIEKHRHGYVLANKQPNGLDHQLWNFANLPEFHASRHFKLQYREMFNSEN